MTENQPAQESTPTAMYYSYDPEDGIEFHDTPDEAKARAEKALADAIFHAEDSDFHWNDNEHEISWGKVSGIVRMNDREATVEDREMFGQDVDFVRDAKLEEVPQ